MSLDIISYGFVTFSVCMIIHIAIWRIKTPWISSFILILIFLVIPSAFFIAVVANSEELKNKAFFDAIELTEIFLLHISLSVAYISTYPAVRAISPSLDILIMIASSEKKRMTEDEMRKCFTDKRLVSARIDDLMEYRFISKQGEYFRLKPIAQIIVKASVAYRKLLGLPIGAG